MKALIFAHFDRDGILDPYVLHSLRTYRNFFDRIILSSPSLKKCPDEARPYIDEFVSRKNVGYDFGSWSDGAKCLSNSLDYDEVFFLNDSVYGPLDSDVSHLHFGASNQLEFWGMVHSSQSPDHRLQPVTPHIQSWFFAMKHEVFRSREFQDFIANIQDQPTKKDIILQYEIGMSSIIQGMNIAIQGVFDYRLCKPLTLKEIFPTFDMTRPRRIWKAIRSRKHHCYNPSELRVEYLWSIGVPYLKVGALKVNHYKLNIDKILKRLETQYDYDTSLISNHLARVTRK